MASITKAEEKNVDTGREATRPTRYLTPIVNVSETPEGYHLEAEMPGVNKERLEITLEGTELTIVGHKRVDDPEGTAVHRESRPFAYRRVFELDPSIDTEKISAHMDQGILKLTLPKGEKAKPKKIKVA